MGTVFRMLCGLVVIMLVGASCAGVQQTKDTASTAKQMVVITIDPETGSVVTVTDTSGKSLKPPLQGQSLVGTLTSSTAITINVELQPASTGASAQSLTTLGTTTCRVFYVNGVQYCR